MMAMVSFDTRRRWGRRLQLHHYLHLGDNQLYSVLLFIHSIHSILRRKSPPDCDSSKCIQQTVRMMPTATKANTLRKRTRLRANGFRAKSSSSPAVRLERIFQCMAITTTCSFMSVLFAWFHSSSMDMDIHTMDMLIKNPKPLPFNSSLLSFHSNTTVPFVDSTPCRQSLACRMHTPLTVVYGETFVDTDLGRDFYLLTQKGFKEGPNQDRSFLLFLVHLSSPSQQPSMLMVGLFDGHAAQGHLTAEAAMDDMPRRLLANLEREQELVSKSQSLDSNGNPVLHDPYPSPAVVQKVLETTFLQVDQGSGIQQVQTGGSTAVVVLQMGPTVYLASAGDSTAFVARYRRSSSNSNKGGEVVILKEARRHKPGDADEMARIIAHGGRVWNPPDSELAGHTSRVVIGKYALAMSRCLGDLLGKPSGVLTAQPEIRTLHLLDHYADKDQFFVVVASDGVVDFMPIQHVAEQVAASLYETSGAPSLAQTCDALIQESSGLWHTSYDGKYRDDMTLVVSKLSL
jgi:serine/threonine protein phosphatase PrpC